MSKNNSSCIGIEISEGYLAFARLESTSEGPQLTHYKILTLPPKTVLRGQISNVEVLSDIITRVLVEMNTPNPHVVMGLNTTNYVKQIDIYPPMSMQELKNELEIKVASTHVFAQEEFQMGYRLPPQNLEENPNPDLFFPVMFAALSAPLVESIKELAEISITHLVAIDLIPLALMRVLKLDPRLKNNIVWTLIIEENWIDATILEDGTEYKTVTFRLDMNTVMQDEDLVENIFQKMRLFLLSFYNNFPQKGPITRMVYFSSLSNAQPFIQALQAYFSDIPCESFDPMASIHFYTESIVEDRLKDAIPILLPAIGLAMHFFERAAHSLSLIPVKKTFGPVFSKRLLSFFAMALGGVIGVTLLSVLLLNYTQKSLQNQMIVTKEQIKRLQTGEYLIRQQQLEHMHARIDAYAKLKEDALGKAPFMHALSQNLPPDLWFDTLTFQENQQVAIKGSAYSQNSIYLLYSQLQAIYKTVKIAGITVDFPENKAPVTHFEVHFQWKK